MSNSIEYIVSTNYQFNKLSCVYEISCTVHNMNMSIFQPNRSPLTRTHIWNLLYLYDSELEKGKLQFIDFYIHEISYIEATNRCHGRFRYDGNFYILS